MVNEIMAMESSLEDHDNSHGTFAVFDTLQTMILKESEEPYCALYSRDKFSALMECYDAFPIFDTGLPAERSGGNIRSIVASFLFEVVYFFGEEKEIAAVAMNYLDRFLGTYVRGVRQCMILFRISLKNECLQYIFNIETFFTWNIRQRS